MSEHMDIENENENGSQSEVIGELPEGKKIDENKSNSKKKRFEIKRWTAVAFWSWDQTNETCAICRNHLMEPCIECQGKNEDHGVGTHIECPRAIGRCNHSFHLHCISTWIQTRNSCPLDSAEWSLKEVVNN